MKRFLLILLAIFCLPIMVNAQKGIRYDTGPYIAGEAAAKERMERNQTRYRSKSNKSYNDYVNRIENQEYLQNQAYLDAKTSAEITVDEATGTTTIKWNDGAMYRGQTYYGEIKGVGTMVYPDGSKYCGQWERDLPNGYGTMLYPDGLAYSANFVNGLPHGKGVVEDADGNKFSARWVYGKLKAKSLKPIEEEK